jgi:hypothetical protein
LSDGVPDFEQQRQNALETARQIESVSADIAKYDSDVIRAAFVQYSEEHSSREALDIVNRYLFQFPQTTESDSHHANMLNYRSAKPLLRRDKSISNSFPWEPDASGGLHFSVESRGFIGTGRPYDAVKAFDYYQTHFGRRGQTPR